MVRKLTVKSKVVMSKAAYTAGQKSGRAVAMAETMAWKSLKKAKHTSSVASKAFVKGFKKGHGKAKKVA